MKKKLWKDIGKSINKSKGRFTSIFCLMLLGSFALVGLKVTGPDMRSTGIQYAQANNVADITVIGELGLDDNDQEVIQQIKGVDYIGFGYLKDVVINQTNKSFRLFSLDSQISGYELVDGRLPEKRNEIALYAEYADDYSIGETIEFSEKEDISGKKSLLENSFTVVGYVYSSEIVSSVNLGQSTAGTGSLNGYGVIMPEVFDTPYYMLARITFSDLTELDPYSKEYTAALQVHKDELSALLIKQPELRLVSLKEEYQKEIDEANDKIADSENKIEDTQKELNEAKEKIDQAEEEIAKGKKELVDQTKTAQEEIRDGHEKINEADQSLADAKIQLSQAESDLSNGRMTLDQKWQQLRNAKSQLDSAELSLSNARSQLESASNQINSSQHEIDDAYEKLANNKESLTQSQKQLDLAKTELDDKEQLLNQAKEEFQSQQDKVSQSQTHYDASVTLLNERTNQVNSQRDTLIAGKNSYEAQINQLEQETQSINVQLSSEAVTDDERVALELKLQETTDIYNQTLLSYQDYMANTYEPAIVVLDQQQSQLNEKQIEIQESKKKLDEAYGLLEEGRAELEGNTAALELAKEEIQQKDKELQAAWDKVAETELLLASKQVQLDQKKVEYSESLATYNANITSYNTNLNQYYTGLSQWQDGVNKLDSGTIEYQSNLKKYEESVDELNTKKAELSDAEDTLVTKTHEAEDELSKAEKELTEKKEDYKEALATFETKKKDAEKEISDAKNKVKEAQTFLDNLAQPQYTLNSRREIPGGEGHKMYSTVSKIIDALANVFPIFLYMVAALVTSTTMSRFVDEERINSGTLKALGYEDWDVKKKFLVYGMASSMTGTFVGVILGHILLPYIVYNAYQSGFNLPQIELRFYPGITAVAFVLAFISVVLPALLAVSKELKEKPSQLLMPKPPIGGEKIWLEYITPLWDRMSFTHKVTARNIFRYKKRMLMTIMGVAGSVTLLFAGLSVQHSISGINERQFQDIIKYQMIVAENDYTTSSQQDEILNLLELGAVSSYETIHYEELTKVAGDNQDLQSIKVIVPEDGENFGDYVAMVRRHDQKEINLADGVVISERLAQLLDVEIGDTVSFNRSDNTQVSLQVSNITEMYMGHFIFMDTNTYLQNFSDPIDNNAYLVNLVDSSLSNTEEQSAQFMALDGVKGVVQNTTLTTQVNTIVNSLDKIMSVLVFVAAMLGIVILYNLTTINVAERMRELSTIKVLGFFDKEVTLYIYRETIVLTLVGIVTGYGLGKWLHSYILNVVPPEDVMFNPSLNSMSFIIPAAIILAVTAILGLSVNHQLKNVDMLEALKSVE